MTTTASMTMAGFVLISLMSPIVAGYDGFSFANGKGSKCPGMEFECPPPQVCAHNGLIDKYYCCGPGDTAICWTGVSRCQPNTIQCDEKKESVFCCLDGSEQCTQRRGQVNICWATNDNPISKLTGRQMKEAYSSLSSASPSATALSFKPAALHSTRTPTRSATGFSSSVTPTQIEATTSNSVSSTPTIEPESNESDSGLSGGEIGGIVGGVVGAVVGVALIAAGGFFLWKRGRRGSPSGYEAAATGAAEPSQKDFYAPGAEHKLEGAPYTPQPQPLPPQELEVPISSPVEMEGSAPAVNPRSSR